MGNSLISNKLLVRILRNLAGEYFSQQVNDLSQKNLNFNREIFQ